MTQGRRELLRDAGNLAAVRLAIRVAGLLVGWLVARLIGPEGLGRLAIPNLLIATAPFLSLGFAEALILRLPSAGPQEAIRLRRRSLAGLGLGGLLAVAALLALYAADSSWFSGDWRLLLLTLLVVGLNLLFKFAYCDLSGRRDFGQLGRLQGLQAAVRAVAVLLLVLLLPSPWKLYALHGGMAVSFAAALHWYARGQERPWAARWEPGAGELIREGLPLAAVALVLLLFTGGDRLLLSRLVSTAELGLYEQAVLLREGLLIVPAVLLTVLIPDYAARAADPRLTREVRRQTLSLGQLAPPLLGLGLSQIGWLVAWLLPAFQPGLDLYRLSFLTALPLFISYIPVSHLASRGRTGALLLPAGGLFLAAMVLIAWLAGGLSGAALLSRALGVVTLACWLFALLAVHLQARLSGGGLHGVLAPFSGAAWLLLGLGLLRACGRLDQTGLLDGLFDGLLVLAWQAPMLAWYQRRTGRLGILLRALRGHRGTGPSDL
jgi:O-antigen/teichoic acid export membrane protein